VHHIPFEFALAACCLCLHLLYFNNIRAISAGLCGDGAKEEPLLVKADEYSLMEQLQAQSNQRMVNTGFILSTVSSALIILQGALHIVRARWGLELGLGEFRRHSLIGMDFKVLGAASIVLGVMVLVGAYFIHTQGRVKEGAITVIAFSALTIVVGGGYLLGVVLGTVGGALAYSHYQPKEQLKQTA